MKIVVAGGSGALGSALCTSLADAGHDVVVLTRRPGRGPHREVAWDGRTVGPWADELDGAAVVNLAGELVDRRPTPANIELLTRSRVEPTRALAAAAAQVATAPPIWVQASTVALHGDAGEAVLTEESPPADGPPQMVDVTTAWEAAADGVRCDRQVILRTSIVLDEGTPALDRLAGLVRWGLGGRVGSGQQWFSWIHVEDWLRLVHRCLGLTGDADPPGGVVIAASPNPVRNAELMRELRRVLRRPPAPPTPTPLVRLGSVFLRTDPLLGLTGRRVVPARMLADGFEFRHPHLPAALDDLLGRRPWSQPAPGRAP